jgi:chorismate lyase/3-hydroxybenzoate synthase
VTLRLCFADHPAALLSFGFEAGAPASVDIGCPRLAGPSAPEAWLSDLIESQTSEDGCLIRRTAGLALVAVTRSEHGQGLEAATRDGYRHLLSVVRGSGQPHILRIWNYFAAINDGLGDAERYRRFCVGRAGAVDARFNDPPPAATAIGTVGAPDAVQIIALCGAQPGIALENPRQTPAWQYPREYGPVPPGFSRGALIGQGARVRLLASGTASIVGHVSRHPDDPGEQARESLANLAALLDEGSAKAGRPFTFAGCHALRVYLRRPEHLPPVREAIERCAIPADRVIYLRGDICRRELLVELEGVFEARPVSPEPPDAALP